MDINNKTPIKLSRLESVSYCDDEIYRNKINSKHTKIDVNLHSHGKIKNVNMLGSVYELKLYECVNIKDLSPLNSITVLKLHTCDKIKDVGYLRKLQKLTISLSMTKFINGIHLLKELKQLHIMDLNDERWKGINKKMTNEIKKLKEINPNVIIKFIYDFV
mgnify:CR=1 FL=1